MRRIHLLTTAVTLAGVALVAGLAIRWAGRAPAAPAPSALTGCARCHDGPEDDPGGAHAARLFGCERCHGGDPAATNVLDAHRGLEREPGALDGVEGTCGSCHPSEAARVRLSLMNTGRGIVAVDRFAFGESATPDGEETFVEVLASPSPSPADDHLRRLCAGCHLGARRANRDDAVVGVGTGCSACHVATGGSGGHPRIDGHVPSDRCLGCHSRSSRISLSYQGLAEVSGPHAAACSSPAVLFDGRAACRAPADVHYAAGMECVDCHVHSELMGDGVSHAHAEDALEVRCESCHGPSEGAAETRWSEVRDPITLAVLRLRGEARPPDERVRVGARGTPLWNLRPNASGGWVLHRKADGAALDVPPTPENEDHLQPGHERLACASCHAAWAPTCPSCHTRFDPAGEQWDFGVGAVAPGAWLESNDGMGFGPPALGVSPTGRIEPAIPGMIATLASPGRAERDVRFFSNLDPHTTSRSARGCADCHASPVALGLGEGELHLGREGPRFNPSHPDPEAPGRALDGWVPLGAPEPAPGTRVGARSLDASEHERILFVGTCLPCHLRGDALYRDFASRAARWRGGDARACALSP